MTQLIQRVQSTGSWARMPSWHVGEEIPSLNLRVEIQLSLRLSSMSSVWGLESTGMGIYASAVCQ